MAKLRSNKSVGELQGRIGDLVYVHMADGTVVVRRKPRPRKSFSAPVKACQSRFALAEAYVQTLKANPALYAPYLLAAKISRRRGCDLAVADFMNPPVLQDIDLSGYTGKSGEPIRIQAFDDIAVSAVNVSLTHLDGTVLEQGSATFDERTFLWTYLTQAAAVPGETVLVHVTALDRPGNTVSKTLHHAVGLAG